MRRYLRGVATGVVVGLVTFGVVAVPSSAVAAVSDGGAESSPVAVAPPPLASPAPALSGVSPAVPVPPVTDPKQAAVTNAPVVAPSTPTGFVPGQSVEEMSLRTATSSTFKNPDGTLTDQISATPIHYLDGSGGLSPVSWCS
jgi:hypothetical protein